AREASFIGIPSQSPTYGLPMLSSLPFGVHSPEKSTCPNAEAADKDVNNIRKPAIWSRLRLRIMTSWIVPKSRATYYTPTFAVKVTGLSLGSQSFKSETNISPNLRRRSTPAEIWKALLTEAGHSPPLQGSGDEMY